MRPVHPGVAVNVCAVCGIGVHFMRLGRPTFGLTGPIDQPGVWIHNEPRTLENNLHNGTRDHDAVVDGLPLHADRPTDVY